MDDEEHRMNVCTKYLNINYSQDHTALSFNKINSNDVDTIRMIITRIEMCFVDLIAYCYCDHSQ